MAAPRRILVLGGTSEARDLANALVRHGHHVTVSLAGVTADALKPAGVLRVGGFGGTEGLADFLRRERTDAVADATHPFATQISSHACAAANTMGLAFVRLERPTWKPQSGDCWTSVGNYQHAAEALRPGAVALLTVGRRGLAIFFARMDVSGVARMISVPQTPLPPNWLLLISRPPLRLETEVALLRERRVTVSVTKNSGGEATAAKLEAARVLGLPLVMIDRPQKPPARVAHTVDAAVEFLAAPAA